METLHFHRYGNHGEWVVLDYRLDVPVVSVTRECAVDIAGKVTGVVEDTSGAAIAVAKVEPQGQALMTPLSSTTQADGRYLFDFVPIGRYELEVEAPGLGLISMRERVNLVGGEISIASRRTCGTLISIRVPIIKVANTNLIVPSEVFERGAYGKSANLAS